MSGFVRRFGKLSAEVRPGEDDPAVEAAKVTEKRRRRKAEEKEKGSVSGQVSCGKMISM